MIGWLVVNAFYKTSKLNDIYGFFTRSFAEHNVQIRIVGGDELVCPVGTPLSKAFTLPDFVIFWDKDIVLAERIAECGVPVFNSPRAIQLCDNKILTATALAGILPTPDTIIAPKTFEGIGYCGNLAFLDKAAQTLGYPLVIKEAYGSFGKQVYLAHNREEACEIIAKIGWKEFVMQRFVATSCGRDVRINVVGNTAACAILRSNDHDFRSNISNGGTAAPYDPTEKQCRVAVAASRALGLDFAGVDILFGDNDEPVVCEVNSNPHFKSTYDCTGVDLSRHIADYVMQQLNDAKLPM